MSLATRCPACGTVFRVVQDQLRVSQGWVRCGRCSEPFNAVESMVELALAQPPAAQVQPEPAAPAPAPPIPPAPPPAAAAPEASARDPVPSDTGASPTEPQRLTPEATPTSDDDGPTFVVDEPSVALTSPQRRADPPLIELPPGMDVIASDGAVGALAELPLPDHERQEPPFDLDVTSASAPFAEAADAPPAAPPAAAPGPPGNAMTASALPAQRRPVAVERAPEPAPPEAPSFLLRAEREARWRRPGVRLLLWCLLLIAGLSLAGQASFAFRDRLAATFPQLRPALGSACAVLGCRIELFRQIDALSVESSGLVRVEGSAVYRLSVTLRNRSTIDVAAPALELSLTDAQGQQVARRVLQMSDLHLPLRQLKGGSEIPIQVPLTVGDRQISGYTVEIFYP